jgi:glucose/arabinose dehydrogenase
MPLERVAGGLHFPTSLAFDGDGALWVAESGLPFAGSPPGGRVLRMAPDGSWRGVAEGLRAPLNGLTWDASAGGFLVAEGGEPGRVGRLGTGGGHTTLVDGLPGAGNYHTSVAVAGSDGWIYFSVGAMTNLGVVGLDGSELAWLRRVDHSWDVPGYDIELAGLNFTSPAAPGSAETVTTGAFSPFGTPTRPGQRVPAGLPCTAAVLRCRPDGTDLALHAWGLRNAFGLGFAPDGRLLATDQGADERGSRPIAGVPELVYEVRPGAWYGWPDFVGGVPVTDRRFRSRRGPEPSFVLANHDELPPPERPLAALPVHAAATRFDFAPPGTPLAGCMLLALFGDERPLTAPAGPRVGRSVVALDLAAGSLRPLTRQGALERPIDVRVDPSGRWLYVLDFGAFEMAGGGRVEARAGSGGVWRLSLAEPDAPAAPDTEERA